MRPLKPSSVSQETFSSSPLQSNRKKEKANRLNKRNEHLIHHWQTTVFLTITTILGFILIQNGWKLIEANQIKIKGNENIAPESIVQAVKSSFPKRLLKIDPKSLEEEILLKLPVKKAVIRRQLFPSSLQITLIERAPIAFAFRKNLAGQEEGFLDEDGKWMSLRLTKEIKKPSGLIKVEGWREVHQKPIAKILSYRNQLDNSVQKIIVSKTGELIIKIEKLGLVLMGNNQTLLDRQLKALVDLKNSLPEKFQNNPGMVIDLSEPSRPELQMPKTNKQSLL